MTIKTKRKRNEEQIPDTNNSEEYVEDKRVFLTIQVTLKDHYLQRIVVVCCGSITKFPLMI